MDSLITERLLVVPQSKEALLSMMEAMPPEHRSQVSPLWLERVTQCSSKDPWLLGFQIRERASNKLVGQCGFTGPPDSQGWAELAYGIEPERQGRGYATEAVGALVAFAMSDPRVLGVYAHTLISNGASARVLVKCGFQCVGEVDHPEDGRVLRWERMLDEVNHNSQRRRV